MTEAPPSGAKAQHLQMGEDDEIDLGRLYGVLRRRWRQVGLVCSAVLAVAVLLYVITPNEYRSTTLLHIERTDLTRVAFEDLFQIEGANTQYYETQHRLLSSRGLAEKVVQNLNLAEDEAFNPPRASLWSWGAGVPAAVDDKVVLGKLADRLLSGLEVEAVPRTYMVEVSYRAATPRLAARVANGVADAYIDWGTERRSSTVGKASAFLTTQVEAVKREISDKEAQLQAYGRSSDIVALDPQSNVILQRLQALNRDYASAVSERINKEARHREFMSAPAEAIAETFSPGLISQLRGEQAKLEREHANKLTTFKPDWPAMQELKAQIDEGRQNLQAVVAETVAKARETARTEYQTALRREQSLAAEMEKQKREAMGLNVAAVEYNNLKVEVSTRRALLDELLRRQSETEVASRLQGGREADVIVVDRALEPLKPYRPSLPLNLVLGLSLGLLLGVGTAFLMEYVDRTLKTSEDVARTLGLPLLATIPDADAGRSYGYYGYGRRRAQEPKRVVTAGPPRRSRTEGDVTIELLPHTRPRLAISEAYRSFRTALLLSTAAGLRTAVVTSAQGGEGKTATVANLGVVMAQLGRNTLVVDCDLRKPRLHQVFGVSNRVGLVDFLVGNASAEELWVPTRVPKLSCVPSGRIPPNPAELLSSDRMREFLQTAGAGGFDFILLDSPPALPVTDATLLGSLVDGVVLCLRAGVVTREDATACEARLRLANVRVLGALLNGYHAESRYGGGYGGHKAYYSLAKDQSADSAA